MGKGGGGFDGYVLTGTSTMLNELVAISLSGNVTVAQ